MSSQVALCISFCPNSLRQSCTKPWSQKYHYGNIQWPITSTLLSPPALPSFRNVKIRTMVNPVILDNTCYSCPTDSVRGTDAVNSKCIALATTPLGYDADCSSGGSCLLFIGIRIIIKITTYSLSYRPLCILCPVSRDPDYYFLFASGVTMSLDMYLSEWWRRFGVYHYPCFLLQTQYNLHHLVSPSDVPSTFPSSSPSEVPTCFPSRCPSSVPSSMPSTIPFSSSY